MSNQQGFAVEKGYQGKRIILFDRLLLKDHLKSLFPTFDQEKRQKILIDQVWKFKKIGESNTYHYLLTDDQGRQYTAKIEVPLGPFSEARVRPIIEGHESPSDVDSTTVNKSTPIYGGFQEDEPSKHDKELVQRLLNDLRLIFRDFTSGFTISKSWAKVSHGVHHFYWLTSTQNSDLTFSVEIYESFSPYEPSRIVKYCKDHIDVTSASEEQFQIFTTPNIESKYYERILFTADKTLINTHTSDLQNLNKDSEDTTYAPFKVWNRRRSNILPALIDTFYWLQSSHQGKSSVVFTKIDMFGSTEAISEHFEGHVNPNEAKSILDAASQTIPGQWTERPVNVTDKLIVAAVTPSIQAKAKQTGATYTPQKVWVQVSDGINYFYWLQSNISKNIFSVNIHFQPNPTRYELTFFTVGKFVPGNTIPAHPAHTLEYQPITLSTADFKIVRTLTPSIQQYFQDKKGTIYKLLRGWISKNEKFDCKFYWIESSSMKSYSILITFPKNGDEPHLIYGQKSFVFPNLAVKSQFHQSKEQNTANNYLWSPFTSQDLLLIDSLTDLLENSSGQYGSKFIPMAAWKQSQLGHHYYWLLSSGYRVYSALVHHLENTHPTLAFFHRGIITVQALDFAINNLVSRKPIYIPHIVTEEDKNLIQNQTVDLQRESGEKSATFEIKRAWINIDEGVSTIYWLESDQQKYTATFWTLVNATSQTVLTELVPIWATPRDI